MVGVDHQTISRLEIGRKSPEGAASGLLRAIADALEIEPAAMMTALASDLLGYGVSAEAVEAAWLIQSLPPARRRELIAAIRAAADGGGNAKSGAEGNDAGSGDTADTGDDSNTD